MGKWSHLVGHYHEHKEALKTLLDLYEKTPTEELENLTAEFYREQKRLAREATEVGNKYQACSELLVERWSKDKLNAKKRSDIGNLSRHDSLFARITDMKVFKVWAQANGIGNLVQETVNANSLTSTVKELIKDGNQIPEGIGIFTKSSIRPTTTTKP
jgi:hypothetical protein